MWKKCGTRGAGRARPYNRAIMSHPLKSMPLTCTNATRQTPHSLADVDSNGLGWAKGIRKRGTNTFRRSDAKATRSGRGSSGPGLGPR